MANVALATSIAGSATVTAGLTAIRGAHAAISTTATATGSANVFHGARAAILANSSISANATEAAPFRPAPSTAGFAGITVDPTPYVYAAAQAILAAVQDASNPPTMAQALLVMSTTPYVEINGVAGSPLALRTGATRTLLSTGTMIGIITGGPTTTYSTNLWAAVANFLFKNPEMLVLDGFSSTGLVRSDGREVLDIVLLEP